MRADKTKKGMPPEVIVAEAAAWLARLQGGESTATDQVAFKEWLAADAAHARAFDLATSLWDVLPRAARISSALPSPRRRGIWVATLASIVLVITLLTVILSGFGSSYATAAGEQRTVVLSDGSKVTLNTASRMTVHYTRRARRVRLERGEALFEVTKNPERPFLVDAERERIRAVGTTFLVRLEPSYNDTKPDSTVAVTLIEGRVEVTGPPAQQGKPSAHPLATLSPGQRATVRESVKIGAIDPATASVVLDAPKLATVAAWRRGDVVFDNVSLGEAVTELNRYGGPHLSITDPSVAHLRVSGVFGIHDVSESAEALAEIHHLKVHPSAHGLSLEKK